MKTTWLFLCVLLVLGADRCPVKQSDVINQDFYGDLASENCKKCADLYREVFNGNLDSLSYDFYIQYIQSNESPSAEGLAERIRLADRYVFETKKNAVRLGLEYLQARVIVVDNSLTTRLDTIVSWNEGDTVPLLDTVVTAMRW